MDRDREGRLKWEGDGGTDGREVGGTDGRWIGGLEMGGAGWGRPLYLRPCPSFPPVVRGGVWLAYRGPGPRTSNGPRANSRDVSRIRRKARENPIISPEGNFPLQHPGESPK